MSTETPATVETRVEPLPPKNGFDKFFEISKYRTNVPREIRAGLTTFLAMSYVIFVNPDVLSSAIVIPGVDNVFSQLVMVKIGRASCREAVESWGGGASGER